MMDPFQKRITVSDSPRCLQYVLAVRMALGQCAISKGIFVLLKAFVFLADAKISRVAFGPAQVCFQQIGQCAEEGMSLDEDPGQRSTRMTAFRHRGTKCLVVAVDDDDIEMGIDERELT